jgi:hypothetical protein
MKQLAIIFDLGGVLFETSATEGLQNYPAPYGEGFAGNGGNPLEACGEYPLISTFTRK